MDRNSSRRSERKTGYRTPYFFRNPEGGPVTTTWWPKKSWFPVLKKLNIRRRKFYATRHTFISWALT